MSTALLLAVFITTTAVPGQCCEVPPACPAQWVVAAPSAQQAAQRDPTHSRSFKQRDTVLFWNEMHLEAIKAERTSPPVASRNLAIMHAAIYDAVNAIERGHRHFHVNSTRPPQGSTTAAAAVAAHRTLIALYPRHQASFDEALQDSLAAVPVGDARINGIKLGNFVAEKILEWRGQDGAEKRKTYKPTNFVDSWRPTLPDYRSPILPQWTELTCFGMTRGPQFRPTSPPSPDSVDFTTSFQEVKSLGAANSRTRTAEQTEIARFWTDNEGTVTPPGHWNRIAQTVSRDRGLSLAENARLFALLNIALADAAVVAWDGKFDYDYWRPVTSIRAADTTGNPRTPPDRSWTPFLVTPPFPSYPSGHSTFSGAASAVLGNFFGTDQVRFTSTSDTLPGVVRSFTSFSSAAVEAGRSRIYGGIHWEFDNIAGLVSGEALGNFIVQNYLVPQPAAVSITRDP